MKKKKEIYLLIFLIISLFVVNYSFLDSLLIDFLDESERGTVKRVIDGDTLVIGNESVRLLGINSPEKGEQYYLEAKEYLEELVLNKSVELEFGRDKYDRYRRKLAYIHHNNKNVNLQIIENGFANLYFPSGKDAYYTIFSNAWEKCLDEDKNLCESSIDKCADCVKLKNLNVREQKVFLENICSFDCDLTGWLIKDEGRKKFIFSEFVLKSKEEITITSEDFNQDYVWTKTGDTIFLRDAEGKLVLWGNY